MQGNQDNTDRMNVANERQGDGHQELSADGDRVYANPLPQTFIDQGIGWDSETIEPPSNESSSEQSA